MELAYILMGLVVGAAIAWLGARSLARQQIVASYERGKAELAEEVITLRERLSAAGSNLEKQEQELLQIKTENLALGTYAKQVETDKARLETKLAEEEKRSAEKLLLLVEAKNQLASEFQNLANKIFDEKSKKFTDLNRENMDGLVKPLREQLTDFKKKVEDVYDKESKDRISLFHEITSLKKLNQQISTDAINLTNALTGQSKTQGNWGEMILERILEASGLRKGQEYEVQGSFTDEEGRRLRPDVVVRLPEGKDVIIDSKISLTPYKRFAEAKDESERASCLKDYLSAVRGHIKGLDAKNYAGLEGIRALDFVLMFIPIEAAFLVVIDSERELFGEYFAKRIMLVSPSTLLVTLRTIQNMWRYEYQNRNAQEIATRAGGLYDQIVLFLESLDDVGDKLGKAQQSFDEARKRLVSGRGNVVSRIETLQELGAKAKKSIPASLLAEAGLEKLDAEPDSQNTVDRDVG